MTTKKRKFTIKGDKRIENGPTTEGDIQNAPPTGYEETNMLGKQLIEHVRKRGNSFVVTNKAGTKTLGTHKSRSSAIKQLDAIEISKHAHGESVALKEEVNVRKLPTNTLRVYANALITKKKNGGHITLHDKQMASLAKKELARRKHIGESVDYLERFNNALEQFGVTNVDELDLDTTKDFLKFVDTQNEMVISANSQKKLNVSDKIKERAAQDMLARAHMKDRLMQKASIDYKEAIKPKDKSDARKLFMKDRKTRSEAIVVEDAASLDAATPNCTYCGGKLQTVKNNHRTQGHSGKCTNCGKTN